MRKHFLFDCAGQACAATLDLPEAVAPNGTGLLIVSGGNEIRTGAHSGQAAMAAHFAALGYPVMRYDRRGVGDSEGSNEGFRSTAPDISAATHAFRKHCPAMSHLVAFGNCDAATALLLFGRDAKIDELLLANPWPYDGTTSLAEGDEAPEGDEPAMPSASAIRARYLNRLKNPVRLARDIFGGKINLGKLMSGLRRAAKGEQAGDVAGQMHLVITRGPLAKTIILASKDSTALAFEGAMKAAGGLNRDIAIERRNTSSHGFASEGDKAWLYSLIERKLSETGA